MSDQTPDHSDHPLRDIPEPHPHDVLCGRGGGTNSFIGNQHWRMLVQSNKELYLALPKRQKMLLSLSIVQSIRSQDPPGRFLQKDAETNLWFDVGDQKAQEKTSQALREGAPGIRAKQESQSSVDGSRVDLLGANSVARRSAPPAMPRPVSPKGPVHNDRGRRKEAAQMPQNDTDDAGPAISMPEPTSGLDPFQGCSFGSLALTDAEEQRLYSSSEDRPVSAESAAALATYGAPAAPSAARMFRMPVQPYRERQPDYEEYDDDSTGNRPAFDSAGPSVLPEPVDGGLEPAGLSMGSVMTFGSTLSDLDPSLMMALEPGGLSIGSVMSFIPETTHESVQPLERSAGLSAPLPVDMGLEDIGISFGSMSLAMDDNLAPPPVEREKPTSREAMPTLLQQAKSKGSLLADIDSDEEEDASSQRQQSFMGSAARGSGIGVGGAGAGGPSQSSDYKQLKAALEAQNYGNLTATTSGTYSTNSRTQMPPPTQPLTAGPAYAQQQWCVEAGVHGQFVIPATNLDRDFSQMSALSVDDADYHPVVPAARGFNQPPIDSFDDAAAMPPPPMQRQGSDHWESADHLY
jgi:hypothetical protein